MLFTLALSVGTAVSVVVASLALFATPYGSIDLHYGWPSFNASNPWTHFAQTGSYWVFAHAVNNHLFFITLATVGLVPYLYAHLVPFWKRRGRRAGIAWPVRSLGPLATSLAILVWFAGLWEIYENTFHLISHLRGTGSFFNEPGLDTNVGDVLMSLLGALVGIAGLVAFLPPTVGALLVAQTWKDVAVTIFLLFGLYYVVVTYITYINITIAGAFFPLGFYIFLPPKLLVLRVAQLYHRRVARRTSERFLRVSEVDRLYLYAYLYIGIMWLSQWFLTWLSYPAVLVGTATYLLVAMLLHVFVLPPLKKRRKWRGITQRRVSPEIQLRLSRVMGAVLCGLALVAGCVVAAALWQPSWALTWNFRGKLGPDPPEHVGHLSILNENKHRTFSHWLNPFLFYLFFASAAFFPGTVCSGVYGMRWLFVPSARTRRKKRWPPRSILPYFSAAALTGAFVMVTRMVDSVLTHLGVQSFNLTGQEAALGEIMLVNVLVALASLLVLWVLPPLPGLLIGWVHIPLYVLLYAVLRVLPGLYILVGGTTLIPLGFWFTLPVALLVLIAFELVHVAAATSVHPKQRAVKERDVWRTYNYVYATVIAYWLAFWGLALPSYASWGIGVAAQLVVTVVMRFGQK